MNRIGKLISTLRKGKGLTQAQLADALEISPGHIGDLERGHRKPTVEMAAKMEAAMKVPGIVSAVVADKVERAA